MDYKFEIGQKVKAQSIPSELFLSNLSDEELKEYICTSIGTTIDRAITTYDMDELINGQIVKKSYEEITYYVDIEKGFGKGSIEYFGEPQLEAI